MTDSGSLALGARFTVNVVDVNPAATLRDISNSLRTTLQDSSASFQDLTSAFSSTFDKASELLGAVAESDKIKLQLSCAIDLKVALDLSISSFTASSMLNQMEARFRAVIADDFTFEADPLPLIKISPHIDLSLEAKNNMVPFDVLKEASKLSSFDFDGYFDSFVLVGVDGVPAQVYARASSDNITGLSNLEFELGLDLVFDDFLTNGASKCLSP